MTTNAREKIHVLHLIGSGGLYGAERWVLALMRAFDDSCVSSTVVNLVEFEGERSPVVAAAQQRGLEALDFVSGGKFNPFSIPRLAGWVRNQKVDIIHGHGYKSDVIGLLAARIAGCKIITTPHGWSLESDRRLQMYETIDRATFRFMDMVCPLSPDLEAGVRKSARHSRVKMILNGVDIAEIESIDPVTKEHHNTFLIGYIGQLIERKDLGTLLKATKILLEGGSKIRLTIIGDGPKHAVLEEEARTLGVEAHVEFTGFRTDATAFLKSFDAFVLPSHMEGIPRCVMESMAAGIPVVASDIQGNRSLVVHGETGLLFPAGDCHDLADKISCLMRNPSETRVMAAKAKAVVYERFSSRNMAHEYSALYHHLLNRRLA